MSNRGGMQHPADSAADILYLVDQLEELVGVGKRVPLSNRVMVEEQDFLGLVDQLRVALPNEIKQAQRVIKERERIIGEAQDEAARIIQGARQHAEKLVSDNVILAEARQRGEEILRQAEAQAQRTRGEMDYFVLEQIKLVEDAVRRGMAVMEDSVEQTLLTMENARKAVGQ